MSSSMKNRKKFAINFPLDVDVKLDVLASLSNQSRSMVCEKAILLLIDSMSPSSKSMFDNLLRAKQTGTNFVLNKPTAAPSKKK